MTPAAWFAVGFFAGLAVGVAVIACYWRIVTAPEDWREDR